MPGLKQDKKNAEKNFKRGIKAAPIFTTKKISNSPEYFIRLN